MDQFPLLERVVLHGIGEPLLNASLGAMIHYLKAVHPSAQVLFNSNAVLLDDARQRDLIDSGLDELSVSIDGASRATYQRTRGIDALDVVVGNLKDFVPLAQMAGKPRISMWLTAMRENLSELPDLVDLAAELGVAEVYTQRLVLFEEGLATSEQSAYGKLRRQEEQALEVSGQRAAAHGIAFRASGLTTPQESLAGSRGNGRPWSACFRPWATTYVTANGNVLPCCISPFSTADYSTLILGNVFETSFAEIWNGPKYRARREALHTRKAIAPLREMRDPMEF